MDSNTLYAAAMVGRQEDFDDQIIKEVWAENSNFSNMTNVQAGALCQDVYDKQGEAAQTKCTNAAQRCGSDKACNEIARRYARALAKGYSGSFDDFKKRSENLSTLGQLGADLLGGLLSNLGNKGSDQPIGDYPYYEGDEPKKDRTGLYILLGVVAAIGIGTAIYFHNKNN